MSDNSDNDNEDIEESNEGGEPVAKRAKLSKTASAKKSDVTLLTPLMVRDHLREVWKQDGVLLKRLYSSLATSPAKNPVDIFFLDIVPVPPSRFRPVRWFYILYFFGYKTEFFFRPKQSKKIYICLIRWI